MKYIKFFCILKGNRALADLRYGKEDSISPSTLMFAAIQGLCILSIYPLRYSRNKLCAEANISVLRHVLSTLSEKNML